ncbi:MAG TPA: DUF3866 family protein [Actinomycetota bacterium]|nr:DUF3866 family protein [Actinomycetota bacterium]
MERGRGGPAVRIRRGTVVGVEGERRGAVVVSVRLRPDGPLVEALAYPGLVGPVAVGDEVVLNTTARALGLGTGGFDLVMAVVGGPDTEPGHPGRTMKLRYTPVQAAVCSVEETHRDVLEGSRGLEGTPVVAAPLHSMIAHAAAGAKAAGAARVVYVMTDGAALVGGLSELVPRLREAGVLDGFVTCGQALGGELEAVSLWTGLLAAKEVLGADAIVVADGPGNLGTDTRWGVSALASGHALNAAEALGGRPVAALRVSFADPRERHRGVSHHSLTILAHVALVRASVAVPALEGAEREAVWAALRGARLEERHQLVEVEGRPALDRLAEAGVTVRSMGRTAADDPAFFLSAGAAGVLAGRMAAANRRWRG